MEYFLEQLGDERFQTLCQALLVAERPGIQCFPLAQSDGGRDAIQDLFYDEPDKTFVVFQVKYVRDPQKKSDPHKWLTRTVEKEAQKVAKLIPKGAQAYYLLTNLPGTGSFELGSVDKVRQALGEEIDIPFGVWWRDDIHARISAHSSIKWSFPEILRASDLLEHLTVSAADDPNEVRRFDAVRAFMVDQYDSDEDVRFKQVELQNGIAKLFVDVPAILTKGPGDRNIRRQNHYIFRMLARSTSSYDMTDPLYEVPEGPNVGAARLLASVEGRRIFPSLVIEGGPGQGKSTLVQYYCQVLRMRLLDKDAELHKVNPSHRPNEARIPIRIDLREYAVWLGGTNPFVERLHEALPSGNSRHLEAFISALIQDGSGGVNFTVADLRTVLRKSAIFLALDGLDEIADLVRRQEVIDEISSASRRMHDLCHALQIVVTTRPSAFTGITEFSTRRFHYIELVSLNRDLIVEYAEKWITAKRVPGKDAAELRRSLRLRLDQVHFRDLARNPMQLTILLSLLHTRGSSLPDKRTALYDAYVTLFLARESEKSAEVRDHQDVLIDVHRYVAWLLHSQAETAASTGRIDRIGLEEHLRDYLKHEGRDQELAAALFVGFQRIVFLVERVEGTLEFEVQPLREYFAARYLYDTSPYSPPGSERTGTMPDRFDGLARNPYWMNVARFFSGCLSKGEIPALVDRLRSLLEDPAFEFVRHPRTLAASLLGDWVFSQHQRSMRIVIELLLGGRGVWSLIRDAPSSRDELVFPQGCGREEVVDAALEVLRNERASLDVENRLCRLVQNNANPVDLAARWLQIFEDRTIDATRWIRIGHLTGVLGRLEDTVLTGLLQTRSQEVSDEMARRLISLGKSRPISADPALLDRAYRELSVAGPAATRTRNPTTGLCAFAAVMSLHTYNMVFGDGNPRMPMIRSIRNLSRSVEWIDDVDLSGSPQFVIDSCEMFFRWVQEPLSAWRTSLDPWSAILEPIRRSVGDGWGITRVAIVSSSVSGFVNEEINLLDEDVPICERAVYARRQSRNPKWWREQAALAESTAEKQFVLGLLLVSAGPATLSALTESIMSITEALGVADLRGVQNLLSFVLGSPSGAHGYRRVRVETLPNDLSPRAAAVIGGVANPTARHSVYQRFLADYGGLDEVVREFCIESIGNMLRVQPSEELWERMISLYMAGSFSSFVTPLRHLALGAEGLSITTHAARNIAGSPRTFPQGLVALAESHCERLLFENLDPLAEVAEEEQWFVDI